MYNAKHGTHTFFSVYLHVVPSMWFTKLFRYQILFCSGWTSNRPIFPPHLGMSHSSNSGLVVVGWRKSSNMHPPTTHTHTQTRMNSLKRHKLQPFSLLKNIICSLQMFHFDRTGVRMVRRHVERLPKLWVYVCVCVCWYLSVVAAQTEFIWLKCKSSV